jgi:hypothetical protein
MFLDDTGHVTPNILSQWLILRIWEVSGSDLGPETGYFDLRLFVDFLSLSIQSLG